MGNAGGGISPVPFALFPGATNFAETLYTCADEIPNPAFLSRSLFRQRLPRRAT